MKRIISLSILLAIIVFAPSSFAASSERTNFEMQEVKRAVAAAEQARSEAVLDQKILEIASNVAAQDSSIDQQAAIDEVVNLIDGEQWVDSSVHRYDIIDSVLRSQGLTIDEKGTIFYSGEWDILRATSTTGADAWLHLLPIPEFLQKLGDNHVGDIDAAAGKVYASIEDGPAYKNPHVGVYDSRHLVFEKEFHLSPELQPDGVPWVAVDPSKNAMYSSSFNNPTEINVYDLTTGNVRPQIHMSRSAPHAQGAKVYNGMMYITTDGAQKGVIKLNMATGTAMWIFTFQPEMAELEGIAIDRSGGQVALDVMGIGYGTHSHSVLNKRSEIHFLKLKTASLRDQLRQKLGTL